jgi:hypoxanthine phosphoribosyltransferase
VRTSASTSTGPDTSLQLVADRAELQRQVARVAGELARDHPNGLTLVAVLKSAVPFLADLVRHLSVPVHIEFVGVAPFDGNEKRARLVKDVERSVTDHSVVVVTGTYDTGLTVDFVSRHLAVSSPRSVRVATLADKPARRLLPTAPDYAALEVPDRFLIGYGLDYAGRYRNLSDLWAVDGALLADDPDRFVADLYGA